MKNQIFQPFVNERTVLLTTYRRDRTPVGTPVNIAVEGDRAFIRTYDTAGKLKRIRNNSEVEIAPSTIRGKPTGPAVRVRAKLLSDSESAHAARAINHKYPILHGFLVPLVHRWRGHKPVYIGLTAPAAPSSKEK